MVKVSLKCLHCGSENCETKIKKPLEDGRGQELHYKCNDCKEITMIEVRVIKVKSNEEVMICDRCALPYNLCEC